VEKPGNPLNYATPQPEPLGRWFLRRFIIFVLFLEGVMVCVAILGRIADHYGLLEFLAQN
jgi:hypothetical protein